MVKTMIVGAPPPARRRAGWVVGLGVVLIAALVFRIAHVAFSGEPPGHSGSRLAALIGGLLGGAILSLVLLWSFYRPGRQLMGELTRSESNPTMIYSSSRLGQALKVLTGVSLKPSSTRDGAFLAFVDLGQKFELWRWHWGRPQCVARVPWARIDAWEFDEVARLLGIDRAIVLSLHKDGRVVQIPLSPYTHRRIRLTSAGDAELLALAALVRSRIAASRPTGISDRNSQQAQ